MKPISRKLYGGTEVGDVARYVLDPAVSDKEVSLRVYDVAGGDALVFLTEARARRLVSDLQRALDTRAKSRRR